MLCQKGSSIHFSPHGYTIASALFSEEGILSPVKRIGALLANQLICICVCYFYNLCSVLMIYLSTPWQSLSLDFCRFIISSNLC